MLSLIVIALIIVSFGIIASLFYRSEKRRLAAMAREVQELEYCPHCEGAGGRMVFSFDKDRYEACYYCWGSGFVGGLPGGE